MNRVKLRLFGAFRDYSENPVLEFDIVSPMTVAEFRELVVERLKALKHSSQTDALVSDSALADEDSTLGEQDLVRAGQELAILPPVCGG